MRIVFSATLLSICLYAALTIVNAQEKAERVKPIKTWNGSVADVELTKLAPKNNIIANEKNWKKIWAVWAVGDELPEIDFKENLILVGTSRGSRLNTSATLKDGDMRVISFGTRDLRPGFRYNLVQVSRKGVKTVNGKAID